MKRKYLPIFLFLYLTGLTAFSQDLEPFALNGEWKSKIASLAPSKPTAKTKGTKRVLIFSLHTGYEHWAIPHTEAMLEILIKKAGLGKVRSSRDISVFEADSLSKFDAVVLNNTCPDRDKRDIFYDVLKQDKSLTEAARVEKSSVLENNLIRFVAEGGGLMLVHGGATMQNDSEDFSFMTGGSFDFHPRQQPIEVKLADPGHPLVRAFKGEGFVHTDEPYFYKNAYVDKNFRPLLYMEASELEGLDREFEENIRYLAWIKQFGEGRVFLLAPSHNAQSFENPRLLQFFADGLQYLLGDLECDDSPIGNAKP